MFYRIYTIRDSKAEVYNLPFYAKTHGEAERSFTQLVRDPKSTIHQFPDDYDLYYLGIFDDQNGIAQWVDTPQHIMKAVNVSLT